MALHKLYAILCLSLSAVPFASAAPTPETLAACAALKAAYPSALAYPTDVTTYLAGRKYWSHTASDAGTPACIFFPTSAKAVSDGVVVLNKYPATPWNMKSGGHMPNPGFNNVDGGVLFAFSSLASTVVSSDRQTADVGPGARWEQAIKALEPYGRAVVGGRIGEVGVAGYLLGGGLSYLSAQYGYACDSVQSMEVVLANSSIVTASATVNSDLFLALKGGKFPFAPSAQSTTSKSQWSFRLQENQVTIASWESIRNRDKVYAQNGSNWSGTVLGHELNSVLTAFMVYGGIRFYAGKHAAALINATHDFTSALPDPKAAIIVEVQYIFDQALEQVIVFLFYDGPTPPPGVFGAFDTIPFTTSDTKTRSYSDMLTSADILANVPPRTIFRDLSYPSLPGDAGRAVYQAQLDQFNAKIHSPSSVLQGVFQAGLTYQPWSRSYNENGRARGGPNAIGANPAEGDKLYSIVQMEPNTRLQDASADRIGKSIVDQFTQYYQTNYGGQSASHADPGTPSHLGPQYLNDANADQPIVQGYADYATLKATQVKYDPNGLFRNRCQGYKY